MMFSDWRKLYDSKITTAQDAFTRSLKNGSRVYIGSACGTPCRIYSITRTLTPFL